MDEKEQLYGISRTKRETGCDARCGKSIKKGELRCDTTGGSYCHINCIEKWVEIRNKYFESKISDARRYMKNPDKYKIWE